VIDVDVRWVTVLVGALGTYALKVAGYLLPESWLAHPKVQRVSGLLPVALLAALVAVQTFAIGRHLTLDARAGGLAVAVIALVLRAPFIVVVILAAVTAALLRYFLGWH
jgi:uncharacterized membrane protein